MYTIKHEYHAYHHSGNRPLSAIRLLVLHDMENTSYLQAAENTGAWFENRASGGSTHYGVDNNSIQQYLGLHVIAWGAPGANEDGVHIEQMGQASWTHKQWMSKAKGTLDRTAWLLSINSMALKANGVSVPLRGLTIAQIKNGSHGVVTHHQLTHALGGTHTDPGAGYPFDWVIERARYYAR